MTLRWMIAALAMSALVACQEGQPEQTPRTGAPGAGGIPSFFPSEALRLTGDPGLVLAEGRHGIELTLGEYNARIREEKLPADLDTTEARERYLQALIDYKVAAVEARLRGYSPSTPSNTVAEEKDLANQILQESILAAASIRDEDAQAFVREHPESFQNLAEGKLQDPGFLQHVKYMMQNLRLREQLANWREREAVEVHVDRLEASWASNDHGERAEKENQP